MAGVECVEVEVVYALPERQRLIRLHVFAGTTIEQAVRQSGMLGECPEIALGSVEFGVFGRRARPDEPVRAGDRIEILRSLQVDPKAVRRLRAQATLARQRAVKR
jgi:putative ubiquitin-RnfH superfamily antitoxin RatB of RatAB toxin-antitoxin module